MPNTVATAAEEVFTAEAADFMVELGASTAVEGSMVAAVTMVTEADTLTAATTAVATMVGTVMAGTEATTGTVDIGAIRTTTMAGDGVLDLAGRMGVGGGDIRTATPTALGITLRIGTTTRLIVLRAILVLRMGMMTLLHGIPDQNRGVIP